MLDVPFVQFGRFTIRIDELSSSQPRKVHHVCLGRTNAFWFSPKMIISFDVSHANMVPSGDHATLTSQPSMSDIMSLVQLCLRSQINVPHASCSPLGCHDILVAQ